MTGALIIDGVMGIILIFFLYRGLVRGFSGEIIGLVGFFVATFCAWKFSEPAVELVHRYIGDHGFDDGVLELICGIAIFFVVEIIFAVIGVILSYLVKVTSLSVTDHLFGMIIGLLKTCFFVIVIYGVLEAFHGLVPEEIMNESYAMKGASYVWPYVREILEKYGILDLSGLIGKV